MAYFTFYVNLFYTLKLYIIFVCQNLKNIAAFACAKIERDPERGKAKQK